MTFATPAVLLVLGIVLPLVAYVGWPRSRFRRVRDSLSLALRALIVTLLVLALAGVQIVRSADRLAVVYLLDASDSMSAAAQTAALDYVAESVGGLAPDDLAGLVVFGENAQIARSMTNTRELGTIRTVTAPGNSNYAAAIRLGLALLPQDASRRIVLLSDGEPTIGDWTSAAQLAAASGVEISYVPFNPAIRPEVQVQAVDVPTLLNEDQEFTLSVTLYSEEATRAVVTILGGGEIINREELDLLAGESTYALRLRSGASGFRDFEVRVEPLGADGFYQNNRLAAFSRVEGTPRVLIVDGSGGVDEIAYLIPALAESGIQTDVVAPNRLPNTVEGLAPYRAVVLVNTAASALSPQRMRAIQTYVRDLGGGLVVIGGPESYGPGGYYQTPLEEALPVEMQIKDQQRLPQLTMAYIIDRSGSMGALSPSGVANIDLAKEAIIRSIDFLQPTDRAAVASFDSTAYWIAEFQDVRDRAALQNLVASLTSSGGTSIVAGMELVAEDIVNEPSTLKHIILLTDGGADEANLVDLVGNLYDRDDVTTSVISIGDFQVDFLQEMAEAGHGNYHQVTDTDTIPAIFAAEAVLATRTYIQEQEFIPLQRTHPILQGIGGLPPLEGYVSTTARPTATVILESPEPNSDPILAAWQYGLGRSVAFTSDATSRWSQNWVTWEGFAPFWSQAIRWTITEGASANLETRVTMGDEQATITVNARDNDGAFLNGLSLATSVVYSTDGAARRVALRQVAPGRYEGTFTPDGEGAYFLRVADEGNTDSALNLTQTTGWVMSYSREYDVLRQDEDVLQRIAAITGGRDISASPDLAFAPTLTSNPAHNPLWPYLLIAAALLLPVDIAVRRLLVTRSDIRRLRAWLAARRTVVNPQTAQRLSTLKEARERARASTINAEEAENTVSRLRNLRPPAMNQPPPAQPGGQARFDSRPTPPTAPPPTYYPDPFESSGDDASNLGSRLLKKRREQRNDDEGR